MFLGEYQFVLDVKSRAIIPAKFRDELGEKFVITRGIDNCLAIYPQNEWEAYTEKINALPASKAREIRRFLYSGAAESELDSHGRTIIPQNLRDYAQMNKDSQIVIIGMGTYIEVWSQASWDSKYSEQSSEKIAELMEELGC